MLEIKCKCGTRMKVREELAGKAVRCPKCKSAVKVPAPAPPPEEEPAEVFEEEPVAPPPPPPKKAAPPPAKIQKTKPAPPPPADEDDDLAAFAMDEIKASPPPRGKKPSAFEDEDEEAIKPARSRKPLPEEEDLDAASAEEDDAPPRRRKRDEEEEDEDEDFPKKKKKGSSKVLIILILLIFLGGGGAAAYFFYFKDNNPFKGGQTNNTTTAKPGTTTGSPEKIKIGILPAKVFISKEWGFTVVYPGKSGPISEKGKDQPTYIVNAILPDETELMITSSKATEKIPEDTVEKVLSKWIADFKGKEVKKKDLTLGDFPGGGVDMKGEIKGDKVIVKGRVYLADDIMYQLLTISSADTEFGAEMDAFLDSFKLTKE